MVNLLTTKRIRDQINATPEQIQEIIDACEYGICVTDENGIFVAVNNRYCEYYGYAREELVGQSFLIVVQNNDQTLLKTLHDKFIDEQREISRTWTVRRKDGSLMNINVDARYTNALDGKPHKLTFIEPFEAK
ncbi:PAS domain S-box protein [Hugenholtzia roseola]|uniref:PAS domain S-box protein n=1 Tax=Hugenholtzia roseola TaxID=1002 RepID=UPI00054F11B3|nr:PAS domain S-box protein [Hugenholtzia roseola]